MSEKRFLGIDIGTTSLKAAVFDESGARLALKSVDYTLSTDGATGAIEFDAETYFTMCRDVIDALLSECGKIDGISVDTQGETLILADKEGAPLAPAVVWLDNRATAEAEEIRAAFGNKAVYDVTGQPEIVAGWPAAKLLWFRRHRPDLFERAERIFLLEDWILYRLTGNFVTEPTIQSSTLYFDIRNLCWWREMLDFLGVPEEKLPKIIPSSTKVGTYRGIPVVSGMLDQIAGTLGAGATGKDVISEMTGTIMAICAMTDEIPPFSPESIVPCHVHAVKGKYCRIIASSTAGMALKWFRNQLAENFSFKELDTLAAAVPAGCEGLTFLPHFCGSFVPRYNPDAHAVIAGLTLTHTRGHIARAIMEAIAFNLKQILDLLPDKVREIRITGGGAASPLWAGIKADVTGRVLKTLCESETACLGAALSAAVGVGAFPDLVTAADTVVKTDRSFAPTDADYREAFERYCALDARMN